MHKNLKNLMKASLAVLAVSTIPAIAVLADNVTNNLDATVDANLEVMNLAAGGAAGSAVYSIAPTDADGKSGCNLTASSTLTVAVTSSAPSVATAVPQSITFTNCTDVKSVVVTPVGAGLSTIHLSETFNNASASFDLAPADFAVNVAAATDVTPPTLHLPGDIVAEATSGAGTMVTFNATATDVNPPNPTVTCTPLSGTTFPVGTTTVNCSAKDTAGNTATGSFLITVRDTTAPVVRCANADSMWHDDDVRIACTARDDGTGLVSGGDASFTLTTDVPHGAASANAFTNSRIVCDEVANCSVAGPVGGNMVDKAHPTIALLIPSADAQYALGQAVHASYACNDAGSGVASCVGTVLNGALIDTGAVGTHEFTVDASDQVGNTERAHVKYHVLPFPFVKLLGNLSIQGKMFNKKSAIPVKFELMDMNGQVAAGTGARLFIDPTDSSDGTPAISNGKKNSNGNEFRFNASNSRYAFNLSAKKSGLAPGSHTLRIVFGNGTHYDFTIRIK